MTDTEWGARRADGTVADGMWPSEARSFAAAVPGSEVVSRRVRKGPWRSQYQALTQLHAIDPSEVRAFLVEAVCPAVCIGCRDPAGEDWHALCEQKADAAMQVLYPESPAIQPPPQQEGTP